MQFTASELNKTNQILMELPLFQNMLTENEELEEQVKMLKHNIMYFESANRKILRKVEKLKMEIKSMKKSKKTKVVKETSAGSDSCFATLEEEEDDDEVVFIKQEKIIKPVANNTIVINLCTDDEPAIKMVIEETSAGSDSCKATLEPVYEDNKGEGEEEEETSAGSDSCKATLEEEDETEEVVEVEEGEEEEEETEEVVEVEGEEDETEEVVEVEGEEVVEVEGKEETEETEEVVEVEGEEEETEEVVEVEGEEETEEVVEVETSAGSDSCKATLEGEETEEEDVYEIEINGKTYYVSNEKNSVIYAADEDGEITIEAGVYKNGKPIFN